MKRSLSEPARLEEALRRFEHLHRDTSALWGVMCAQEMVRHLSDAMDGAAGLIPLKTQSSPLRNPLARYFALYSGIPWRRNFPTVPELERRGLPGPDPGLFAADIERLRSVLRCFASLTAEQLNPEHPLFGPMSREDWMAWAFLHADHHLRQFGC